MQGVIETFSNVIALVITGFNVDDNLLIGYLFFLKTITLCKEKNEEENIGG